MIHAKDLFPIAMDRIHDLLDRDHATRTAKAQALLDAFDEGERKRGKRGRKANDRDAIRDKSNAERARGQMELGL